MNGFLREVAEQLYASHGEQISELRLIFPSRRSRLFFTDALAEVAVRPLWQPHWESLDELMSEATSLAQGDRIMLITELYKIYSTFHKESFDKFYFWGEVLLSDFDMVDKYLIDADMLFSNISDIKEVEADLSYMTDEQIKIITTFWSTINDGVKLSDEKRKFLKVWQSLAPIYHQFRKRLTELGVGYTGMIQRSAVDRFRAGEFSFDRESQYVAIGFNALTECEKILFDTISTLGKIDFFWDYDSYYSQNRDQEAGLFIRENIRRFPSSVEVSHDNFHKPKSLEVVAAASNALQCKYVAKIVEYLSTQGSIDKETAIVLTDENLLTPLLYSLPEASGKVNVTMGYPLHQSLAYAFLERILELQSHTRKRSDGRVQFYYIDVIGVLSHPYIDKVSPELFAEIIKMIRDQRMISVDRDAIIYDSEGNKREFLTQLFTPCSDWQSLSNYLLGVISAVAKVPYEGDESRRRIEFLALIADHIMTLRNSIEMCTIEISFAVYLSLLRRQLQTLRIPFEGEPLEGIQVMGILETRNLDFRNVIILSMNDDNFPGNRSTKPSYIPYNLRSAYGIPTPEHHEGVYAYYFYRLIQRAERVWMLYCSHADDKSTGEPSRYIRQLEYESRFKINYLNVGVDVSLMESQPIEVKKEGRVAEQLAQFTDPENPISISPTAFYRYVACPLRFYFYSLARIKSSEEMSEEVDAPMFGTILHDAMQRLYEPLVGKTNIGMALTALLKGNQIESAVEQAINENYLLNKRSSAKEYSGNLLLVKEIVSKYIRRGVITYDSAHSDFTIEGVEKSVSLPLPLNDTHTVLLKGISDRIDKLSDGTLRVVDYKTGSKHLDFESIESLFEGDGLQRQSNVIQTMLYSMMLNHKRRSEVRPALYYVRNMHSEEYSPLLIDGSTKPKSIVESYTSYSEEFESHVMAKLTELFDYSIPFKQCNDIENTCKFCDYKDICKR